MIEWVLYLFHIVGKLQTWNQFNKKTERERRKNENELLTSNMYNMYSIIHPNPIKSIIWKTAPLGSDNHFAWTLIHHTHTTFNCQKLVFFLLLLLPTIFYWEKYVFHRFFFFCHAIYEWSILRILFPNYTIFNIQ